MHHLSVRNHNELNDQNKAWVFSFRVILCLIQDPVYYLNNSRIPAENEEQNCNFNCNYFIY